MARTTGILSLGTRADATTWEKGCERLSVKAVLPIKKGNPSLDELKTFFASKHNWLFLAGHFGSAARILTNESSSVEIVFNKTGVNVTVGDETVELTKKANAFNLHTDCELVLWGGCNVCGNRTTVETLRELFGNHVMLGFAGLTGWKMVDAMLGNGFMKSGHFFDRLDSDKLEAVSLRDAWMKAALKGYGGGENESLFRAIDPEGQGWRLSKKKITRWTTF